MLHWRTNGTSPYEKTALCTVIKLISLSSVNNSWAGGSADIQNSFLDFKVEGRANTCPVACKWTWQNVGFAQLAPVKQSNQEMCLMYPNQGPRGPKGDVGLAGVQGPPGLKVRSQTLPFSSLVLGRKMCKGAFSLHITGEKSFELCYSCQRLCVWLC